MHRLLNCAVFVLQSVAVRQTFSKTLQNLQDSLKAPHSAFVQLLSEICSQDVYIVHVRPHWQAACLVCMHLVEEAVLPSVQLISVWRPVWKQWCEFWAPHQGSSWTWMPKILMGFTGLHMAKMQKNLQSWLWSLTSLVWSVSFVEALQEVQRHKKRKKQISQANFADLSFLPIFTSSISCSIGRSASCEGILNSQHCPKQW